MKAGPARPQVSIEALLYSLSDSNSHRGTFEDGPLDSPTQRANVALTMTKTIAYLRVSTDKQADRGVSLDAQRVAEST